MDARDAVLQRIVQRITRMREAVERFNDEAAERAMVGPSWNVRDLVGHMAYWTRELAGRITALARGGPAKTYDFDTINAEIYRTNRRMSHVMLLPQLRAAEEELTAAVRRVPPELMIDSPVRDCADAVIEHYDHHWPGLKKAVAEI